VPTSAREIAARVNQITFGQAMLCDIEVIGTVRRLHGRWGWRSSPADARLARQRFHLIEAGRFTAALSPESKAKPEMELLTYLFGAGRSETEKWLARNRASIGARETVDLAGHFLTLRTAANSPTAGISSPTAAA
jgi:NTE family protein